MGIKTSARDVVAEEQSTPKVQRPQNRPVRTFVSGVQKALSYISFCFHVIGVLLLACIMNTLWCIPSLRRGFFRHLARESGLPSEMTDKEADEFGETSGSFEFVRTLISQRWRETQAGIVTRGSAAFNAVLHPLSDIQPQCHLLDFAKPGRPLVVNFGSSS